MLDQHIKMMIIIISIIDLYSTFQDTQTTLHWIHYSFALHSCLVMVATCLASGADQFASTASPTATEHP